MTRPVSIALCALLLSLWHQTAALAVQPGEALADPVLEGRARELSTELRCMVCQNQSIDISDAELARDLRLLVRERLSAGDSNEEVLNFVVARYGEFVLLKPKMNLRNALLWSVPALLLLTGAAVMLGAAQSRRRHEPEPLDAREKDALDEILRRDA